MDNAKKAVSANAKVVGVVINTLLATRGISQKKLASYLNVKDNVVSYFVSGARIPNTEQIISIAKFFDVSADYLLGLQKEESKDLDVKAIRKMTGLSDIAIENLRMANRAIVLSGRSIIDVINILIEQCAPIIAKENEVLFNDVDSGEWENDSLLSMIDAYIYTSSTNDQLFVTDSGQVVPKQDGLSEWTFAPQRAETINASEIIDRVFLARIEYLLKKLRDKMAGDVEDGKHS